MNSTYTISEVSEYSEEVLSALKRLVSQLDTHFQPLTEVDVRDMIASSSNHLYFVYTTDRAIIGMVTLIVYRIPYKLKAWIEDIVVDEAYRGQGIGRALMGKVIDEAKRFEVKSLNLTSNPKRENANKLYQHLGFEKRDTNVYRLEL